MDVPGLLPEELAEEGEILAVGSISRPQLAGDDRADVRGHQHLEALLRWNLGPELGRQVLGDGFEQFGGGRPILHQPAPRMSWRRSHSGSQIRRPREASSWLRRTPLRWSCACFAQITAHLTFPNASQ